MSLSAARNRRCARPDHGLTIEEGLDDHAIETAILDEAERLLEEFEIPVERGLELIDDSWHDYEVSQLADGRLTLVRRSFPFDEDDLMY